MSKGLATVIVGIALITTTGDGPAFQGTPPSKVEKLGPFMLGPAPSQRLTLIANYRPAPKPFEGDQTLAVWTIQDATGATLFRQVIDPEKHPERFADVTIIQSVGVLVGQCRRFLLVEMGQEPSAPPGGSSYLVFAFDRAGKLKQFARLVTDGPGLMKKPGPTGEIPLNDGRFLDVAEWTSWFYMTYRYEYDDARETFVSNTRCSPVRDATLSGEALQERIAERDNVITLRRSMDATSSGQRIAVNAATKVQLLQACFVPASRSPNEQTKTYFLQIRIDGRDGWIAEDDFRRLGLQQAG
jgi:hypothetical protein